MSGALGRGSYHSVVAGTQTARLPSYYPSSFELVQLHRAHLEVLHHFSVRDKVIDNKFPGCAFANGLFKMIPQRREQYHMKEVLESIRRRSIWMARITNQRAINSEILQRASPHLSEAQLEERFSYKTPDSDAYFRPMAFKTANTFPNYWQHPTQQHVIPRPRWKRVPELGGITRVVEPVSVRPTMDY